MRNKKIDLVKYGEVLSVNRLSINEDFKKLFLKDLYSLITDYFEVKEVPQLDIVKEGNLLNVSICYLSSGLKQFKITNI